MRAVGSNALYTKLPPMHVTRATPVGLRLDAATGHVDYIGEYSASSSSSSSSSSGSESDDREGVSTTRPHAPGGEAPPRRTHRRHRRGDGAALRGDRLGGAEGSGSAPHPYGLTFTATPFLRPKQLMADVQYAPGALTHAAMLGFYEEGVLFLFGGSDKLTKPTNHTWIYAIPERRWLLVNPLEVVADHVAALRRSRGLTGERVPPPRAGHTCSAVRDVREVRKIDPATLQLVTLPDSDTKKIATTTPSLSSYEPSVLMFGGADLQRGVYFHDLWLFDIEALAWRELKPGGKAPKPRWHHSAAVLERRLYIYGGESSEFQILHDLQMYDHDQGMWRALRTVDPIPSGRMLHAVAVVGDSMVVVGGIGANTTNGSILDAARGQVPLGSTRVRQSIRRYSAAAANDRALTTEAPREELSDVWVLCMRTLVWREIAASHKATSPFAVRDDAKIVGMTGGGGSGPSPVCTRGSDTGPALPPALRPLQLRSLEGHSATAFDHRVLVMGGRLSGKTNRHLFLLDIRTENWSYLGELPSGRADSDLPPARFCHASCVVLERSAHNAMRAAAPLSVLEAIASAQPPQQATAMSTVGSMAHMDLLTRTASVTAAATTNRPLLGATTATTATNNNNNTTTRPNLFADTAATLNATTANGSSTAPPSSLVSYVDVLLRQLASQISFSGVLSTYDQRPIVSRTVCCYVFGGGGNGKQHSDLWRMELRCAAPTTEATTYDYLFGSAVDKLQSGASRTEFGGPTVRKPPLLLPLTQHQQKLLDTTLFDDAEADDLSDEQWAALGNYLRGVPPSTSGGAGGGGGGARQQQQNAMSSKSHSTAAGTGSMVAGAPMANALLLATTTGSISGGAAGGSLSGGTTNNAAATVGGVKSHAQGKGSSFAKK